MGHLPPKTKFGYSPALALFEKPSVDTGIIGCKWVQYRPLSQISDSGVLQFTISGTSNDYVNLQKSRLQVKGHICNASGDRIANTDEVSLENLPLQTLWNQVDLSLQQQVISSKVGTNYAYKSYLDVILNSSVSEMDNQLTSQVFFKDDGGFMDKGNGNSGYRLRKKYVEGGAEVEMEGPLYLDICQQERPILNGVEINLKFWANKAPFIISSNSIESGYHFKITDANLYVCMVEVSPAILVGHAAALKESPALYPLRQSDFKAFSIPKGEYRHAVDNIFQGDVPSELIVGIVSSEAYIGAYNKNPFNFYNYDCNYCGFFINGNATPTQPFQPRYDNPVSLPNIKPDSKPKKAGGNKKRSIESVGNETLNNAYVSSYLSLFDQYRSSTDVPISRIEYPNGYCLYRFRVNENSNGKEVDFISPPRRGHTRLSLKFAKPLPESVTVIVYAHFPRTLQIDEARNVIFNP